MKKTLTSVFSVVRRALAIDPPAWTQQGLKDMRFDDVCRRLDITKKAIANGAAYGLKRKKMLLTKMELERELGARLAVAESHMQWLKMAYRFDPRAGFNAAQAETLFRRAQGYQEEIDKHLSKDNLYSSKVVGRYRDYLLTEAIKACPVTVERLSGGLTRESTG